jgi:16S rRNA (adenine1518-N6/adenine1519-N6)-dimethyltransferase
MTRQRLGQHFLADPEWREKIARAIRVSRQSLVPTSTGDKSSCWIEIGPGHGEMTEHLVATGDAVYAIEIDAALARRLQHIKQHYPNLNIIAADILKINIADLAAGRRVRVYGNLPYYITSPILHHLFEFADLIDEIHIVIQTEVAERVAGEPGTKAYGYLSVLSQFYTRPEFVFEIPRRAFEPPPEVTSALITLRLPGQRAKLRLADEAGFLEFSKHCFAQKRKTLVNNLRAFGKPDVLRKILTALDIRPDARAEQLALSQLAALYSKLQPATAPTIHQTPVTNHEPRITPSSPPPPTDRDNRS